MNDKKAKLLRRMANTSGATPETVYTTGHQGMRLVVPTCVRGVYKMLKREGKQ